MVISESQFSKTFSLLVLWIGSSTNSVYKLRCPCVVCFSLLCHCLAKIVEEFFCWGNWVFHREQVQGEYGVPRWGRSTLGRVFGDEAGPRWVGCFAVGRSTVFCGWKGQRWVGCSFLLLIWLPFWYTCNYPNTSRDLMSPIFRILLKLDGVGPVDNRPSTE